MAEIRVAFILVLVVLGVPSLLAPLIVRFRPWIAVPLWRSLAVILCLVPLSAPLGMDRTDHPGRTLLIAIMGGIVMLKTIDWLSNPRYEDQSLRVWLAMSFWPALQIEDVGVRIIGFPGRIALAVRRLAGGAAGVAVGLLLTAFGQSLDLPARSIWLDGSLKALEIYALAGGASSLMVGVFALAGYQITEAFHYPIFARSVLDFWSRYDVWIYRWLKRHVFEPIGRRRRRPALGILAVFAVSGLLHEFLIVVAVPEMIGWQFAFFGLHGLGALGGAWLGRGYRAIAGRRAPRALAIAATLAFVLLTAPIFIRCMDRIIDLHRDVGRRVLDLISSDRVPSNATLPTSPVAASMIDCDDGDLVVVPRHGRGQIIIGLRTDDHRQAHRRDSCKRALTSAQGVPPFGSSRWASRRRCKSAVWASESENASGDVAMLSQSSSTRMIRSAALNRSRPKDSTSTWSRRFRSSHLREGPSMIRLLSYLRIGPGMTCRFRPPASVRGPVRSDRTDSARCGPL